MALRDHEKDIALTAFALKEEDRKVWQLAATPI